jgi:hypothetical protein
MVQRKCVAIFVLHINYKYASSFSLATTSATVASQLEIRPYQNSFLFT